MIRIAKKMIPRRFLNYPVLTNHVHKKKKPISPSPFACKLNFPRTPPLIQTRLEAFLAHSPHFFFHW